MKILVDLRKVSLRPSGIGMYIYQFIKSLCEYKNISIVGVSDVVESNQIKDIEKRGIRIIQFGEIVNGKTVFKYNSFIKEILECGEFTHFWQPNFIIPYSFCRIRNVKKIITIHDISPICDKQFYSLQYRLYFKIFLARSIKACDIILYDSKDTKEKTEKIFREAVKKKNLVTYIPIENRKKTEQFKIGNYFLYVGNIEKRKGVHLLIDAYKKYIYDGGSKDLKLVGGLRDITIKNQYIETSKQIGSKIEYIGYVDEEKKERLTNECYSVIFPSYAEGFGMPPLEAILSKKKCIVSNIKVLKEVLEDTPVYFELDYNNYWNSVENLASTLHKIENYNLDEEKVETLQNKYNNKNLTKKLVDFWNEGEKSENFIS